MPLPPSLLGSAFALRVFLCFAGAYLLSYAFRAINAVIAPALMEDLALSNADLGLLSSAYFVSFASMQLPLGVWLDKYGARRTEAALLLFAAAGAAIFALSSTLTGLWIGRALIGVGVSACLMAPLKAYRQWYAPEQQSQLLSRMLVAGTTGVLATTVPVATALPYIGWRGVFWLMAALILLAALAIYFLLVPVEKKVAAQTSAADNAAFRDAGQGSQPQEGYAQVFGNPFFRRLAPLGAINQGTFAALQTLWAGPWMITVLGMTVAQTSQVLFVFNLCLLVAYLVLSWWAPRHVSYGSTRGWPALKVITFGLAGAITIQAMILTTTHTLSWLLWIALAAFVSLGLLLPTYVSLSFPPSLAGRANSAYNLMIFVGAFLAQWGIGVLIDLFQSQGASPADAMRAAFAVVLVLQITSLIAFAANKAQPNRELALP